MQITHCMTKHISKHIIWKNIAYFRWAYIIIQKRKNWRLVHFLSKPWKLQVKGLSKTEIGSRPQFKWRGKGLSRRVEKSPLYLTPQRPKPFMLTHASTQNTTKMRTNFLSFLVAMVEYIAQFQIETSFYSLWHFSLKIYEDLYIFYALNFDELAYRTRGPSPFPESSWELNPR